MQSSYSLVKKNYVLDGNEKTITTEYTVPNIMELSEDRLSKDDLEKRRYLSSYENIGKNIIADAQKESERIKLEALKNAEKVEKSAYEKGYSQGVKNGYEDGKNEAIQSVIPKAEAEAKNIKNKALAMLTNAEADYEKYMQDKSDEIINLAFNIARKILNREVLKDDGVNSMIEEAFQQSRGESNFVIMCNEVHIDSIKTRIEGWKKKYGILGEIFVIEDNDLEPGNICVEKPSGKVEVGIDIGLAKLEEAIFG
ncbi:MAG: flagellar biosynthesis protein [Clostridium sp.]|uniref:FliH/SctL family protein n=1 Tax=Clostridium sp. DSM 8431 TaxID=1761781 RepID=UPI0008E85F7D|nr:FliH/SctL family protein [Clostridium sp. DSM 8431]MCR4944384.1 flagellar biosynthesis protein [Clostridium sp.]SFU30824.1 flagellar assembly protein FliH [Clostridium sp. DSM 8431]